MKVICSSFKVCTLSVYIRCMKVLKLSHSKLCTTRSVCLYLVFAWSDLHTDQNQLWALLGIKIQVGWSYKRKQCLWLSKRVIPSSQCITKRLKDLTESSPAGTHLLKSMLDFEAPLCVHSGRKHFLRWKIGNEEVQNTLFKAPWNIWICCVDLCCVSFAQDWCRA